MDPSGGTKDTLSDAMPSATDDGGHTGESKLIRRHEPLKVPEHHEAQDEQYKDATLVKLVPMDKKDPRSRSAVKDWPVSIAYFRTSTMHDGVFLPPNKIDEPYNGAGAEEGEIKMFGSFSMLAIAPGIRLNFTMHRGGTVGKSGRHEKEHTGSVLFLFHPVWDHKSRSEIRCIRPGTFNANWHSIDTTGSDGVRTGENLHYLEMSFTADFAVAESIVPPFTFPSTTTAELVVLKALKELSEGKGSEVTIRFYPFLHEVKEKEKNGGMFEMQVANYFLPNEHQVPAAFRYGKNFNAYKRPGKERVGIQHNTLISRFEIVSTETPFQLMPAAHRFIDKTHAEIALGYGSALEFEETKAKVMAITNDQHICTVHLIHSYVVVGIHIFEKPDSGLGSAYFAQQPNTKLKLSIKSNLAQTGTLNATGITTDMDLDMSPPATTYVLLTGKEAMKLHPIAQRGLRLTNAKKHVVEVDLDVNETVLKYQLDAIRKAYDPEAERGSHGAWLDLLLFDGLTPDSQDIWAGCKDQKRADQAFAALKAAENWTETQAMVLDWSKSSKLRTTLVTGCGGSGKTLIQVHKAHAIVKAGDKVAFVSDRNAVLDTICQKYVDHYPRDEPPVRAYARQLSKSSVAHKSQPRDSAEGIQAEELLIVRILQKKREEAQNARFGLLPYSIEGHIMRHMEAGTAHAFQFTVQDEQKQPVLDTALPHQVNAFAFLENCLHRVRAASDHEGHLPASEKVPLDHGARMLADDATVEDYFVPLENDTLFTDNEQRWFDQVWEACRKYVLNHANIILSTAINCGSDEVSMNFASGKDRVWLEVDEATTIHEASLLVPLAKCYPSWGCKIVSLSLYGDPKQLGPMVFGSDGSNKSPAFNEFGPQIRLPLFNRLVKSGLAVFELPEQTRMHPALWKHANRIFYDYNIKFIGDLNKFTLHPGWEGMIRGYFQCSDDDTLTQEQLRMVWLEAPGNNTRRSRDTGSRANLANFRIAMNLVKGQLHEIFKHEMNSKVALLTPYQRQRQMYAVEFNQLRKLGWTDEQLPLLRVVDSMVGNERDYVLFDTVVSVRSHRGLGFVRDEKRMCVANTRARKAIVYIGSDLIEPDFGSNRLKTQAAGTQTDATAQGIGSEQAGGTAAVAGNADDKSGKRKGKNDRLDQFGKRMEEFSLAEYREICSRNNTVVRPPFDPIHECDWPFDLWNPKLLPGFDAVKKTTQVNFAGGNFVALSKEQKALVLSETARIEKEQEESVQGRT